MVDGISSAVPGLTVSPGTGTSNQTRTAALESAFPGLRVLGGASDATQQQQQKQDTRSAVGSGQGQPLATGDTLLAAQQQDGGGAAAGGDGQPKAPGELTEEEKQLVAKLKQTDAKVRAHERAHAAAGGQYAGAPSYGYTRGPDGQRYAVSGEVSIDIGAERDPEATLQKATQVQAAALAPADPSGQDRAVAAAAAQLRLQALAQIREEKQAESEQQQAERADEKAKAAEQAQTQEGGAQQGDAAPAAGNGSATETGAAAASGTAAGTAQGSTAQGSTAPGSATQGSTVQGSETPAARASRAYANDNAGLNRLVGQVVGISA